MPAIRLLHGYSEPGPAQPHSRIPDRFAGRLPVDTGTAARTTSGVRLELRGTAPSVRLTFTGGGAAERGAPTMPAAFSVWTRERHHGQVAVRPGDTAADIPLPSRPADETVFVYLPEPVVVRVESVSWADGTVEPAPKQPVWVVYGDSIAAGWSATDPGLAWPAVVAREIGLDVVNLGFAGAARGELPSAAQIAETPADLITLAWGTNCWAAVAHDRGLVEQQARLFLETVRHGHPDTEILVVSPIVRPAAEETSNAWGATLADLRSAIESGARDAKAGGPVSLLRGFDLVPEDLLVDGVHPGDAGHARIAAVVTAALRGGLPPGP